MRRCMIAIATIVACVTVAAAQDAATPVTQAAPAACLQPAYGETHAAWLAYVACHDQQHVDEVKAVTNERDKVNDELTTAKTDLAAAQEENKGLRTAATLEAKVADLRKQAAAMSKLVAEAAARNAALRVAKAAITPEVLVKAEADEKRFAALAAVDKTFTAKADEAKTEVERLKAVQAEQEIPAAETKQMNDYIAALNLVADMWASNLNKKP